MFYDCTSTSKRILRLAFGTELYHGFALNVCQSLENSVPSPFAKAKSSLFVVTVSLLSK